MGMLFGDHTNTMELILLGKMLIFAMVVFLILQIMDMQLQNSGHTLLDAGALDLLQLHFVLQLLTNIVHIMEENVDL